MDEARGGSIGLALGRRRGEDKQNYPLPQAKEKDNVDH
jgi:hypothetical protein